jgi:hypothetical protein
MNDQLEGSSLEAALEFLRQRDTYRNRLLAELQALEARAEKIKSVLRELGPVDQPAEKTLMLKGQNGLRHKPPGLKDATIPEVICHILGQFDSGMTVGEIVTGVMALRGDVNRTVVYPAIYRMADPDDGRLVQKGDRYFLPAENPS